MNSTNNKNVSASCSIALPPSQGRGNSAACDDDNGLRSILAAAIGLTSLGAPKKANASTAVHDGGNLLDGPLESSSGPTTMMDKSLKELARKKKSKKKKYKLPKTAVTKEAKSTSVPSPQLSLNDDQQPVTPYFHLFPDYPNPPTSSTTSPPRSKNAPLPPERQKINQRSWTTTPLEAATSADGDGAEMITRKLHMLRLIYAAYSIYTYILCVYILYGVRVYIYTQFQLYCIILTLIVLPIPLQSTSLRFFTRLSVTRRTITLLYLGCHTEKASSFTTRRSLVRKSSPTTLMVQSTLPSPAV